MAPRIDTRRYLIEPDSKVDLAKLPTEDHHHHGLDKESAKAVTAALTARLAGLQDVLWAQHRHRVLVVLQATDTGGKDSTIRSVFSSSNPQGVTVAGFKAPTEDELAHDYLWRVHQRVPGDGEIVVFNRSHYEDVLVVRVHDLVPEERWQRRYAHIRHFERLLVDEGTTIVKFFLHISKDEQRERLQSRVDDPTKHWKFNAGDLAEREHWDDYQRAYADALAETSTTHAPWYVVPADKKWFRDVVVAQVMVDLLESLDLAYPPPAEGVEGMVIE